MQTIPTFTLRVAAISVKGTPMRQSDAPDTHARTHARTGFIPARFSGSVASLFWGVNVGDGQKPVGTLGVQVDLTAIV